MIRGENIFLHNANILIMLMTMLHNAQLCQKPKPIELTVKGIYNYKTKQ